MKWTKIEVAVLQKNKTYLCWDGKETYQSSNDNLPPDTTHVIKIEPPSPDPFNLANIEDCVLQYFKIPQKYLHKNCKDRHRKYTYPRQMLWYILRYHTDIILDDIAKMYGYDRSTIIHGINTIKDTFYYADVKKDYHDILKLIKG